MVGLETYFDKVWALHQVADLGGGQSLLHVDRTLLHDLSGLRALTMLAERGEVVRNPKLCTAAADHTVSSAPGSARRGPLYEQCIEPLRRLCADYGIQYFDVEDSGFGILHVIGPEQGLTLPGATLVCGDSHTCTHGGLGALAWGIGSSELVHVLATQTIIQRKPKLMRVCFDGVLPEWISAKDMVLHVIGCHGTGVADGYAVEYAGSAIAAMPIEGRLTICNMSIEMGAKIGMVAPDDITFDYLLGRPLAPSGENWCQAIANWRGLASDAGAGFDREIAIDVSALKPQITWGTSPEHVIDIDAVIPEPVGVSEALHYMGLRPGDFIEGTTIDRVFIGSCTNARLSDFRLAAKVVEGRKVAAGVEAWAVAGSAAVKAAAEAEGLDGIFRAAGFEWREPGCSLCVGANGETLKPGQRSVSTSNRNFVGRQGRDSRTHLASPAMAAAAAVTGMITDVRKLMS